jgi:hypothetical protein
MFNWPRGSRVNLPQQRPSSAVHPGDCAGNGWLYGRPAVMSGAECDFGQGAVVALARDGVTETTFQAQRSFPR